MTQEQKFKAILQRAIDNGWDELRPGYSHDFFIWRDKLINTDPRLIIFSKSFARAFWGEEPITCSDKRCIHHEHAWQFYLQQLVLQEDYISYLYSFIEHTTTDKGDK